MESETNPTPRNFSPLHHLSATFDHTLLEPDMSQDDARRVTSEALELSCASVCLPLIWISEAHQEIERWKQKQSSELKICSVVGFPHGNSPTKAKLEEVRFGLDQGADELDIVVNQSWVRERRWDLLESELKKIRQEASKVVLKLICESSVWLPGQESSLVKLCQLAVGNAGFEFVKTSTGFHRSGGATPEAVELMVATVKPLGGLVKASGGIRTLAQAKKYLELGASRLGLSRSRDILQELAQLKEEGAQEASPSSSSLSTTTNTSHRGDHGYS